MENQMAGRLHHTIEHDNEGPSQLLKEFLGADVSGLGEKMFQAEGPVRGFLKENAPLE